MIINKKQLALCWSRREIENFVFESYEKYVNSDFKKIALFMTSRRFNF